jgi:hypothetical protein
VSCLNAHADIHAVLTTDLSVGTHSRRGTRGSAVYIPRTRVRTGAMRVCSISVLERKLSVLETSLLAL